MGLNDLPPPLKKTWNGFYAPEPLYLLILIIVGGGAAFVFGELLGLAHPASFFVSFGVISLFVASGLTITKHPHALLHRVVFLTLVFLLSIIQYPWE